MPKRPKPKAHKKKTRHTKGATRQPVKPERRRRAAQTKRLKRPTARRRARPKRGKRRAGRGSPAGLIRTAKQYFAMRSARNDVYHRALQVLTDVRHGKHPADALRDAALDRKTVLKLVGHDTIRVLPNGRWIVSPRDTLIRRVHVPDERARGGKRRILLNDSAQATLVSQYQNAISTWIRTGKARDLRQFDGTTIIDANGRRVPLLTDLKTLRRLGYAGNLSFSTIYSK